RLRWSNLPLRAKGFVVVAIPVLGLVGSQAAFLAAQRAYTRSDQAVRETTEARSAIRSILISALDAETSVRGFLLTGDRTLLYGLRQAEVAVPQHLARLERLASRPADVAAVARIARLVDERLSVAEELRMTTAGDDRQALLQEGRTVMSYLRTQLNVLQARVEGELSVHTARAERYRSIATATGTLGLAIGLLGGLAAATIFTTGVVRRVRKLEENAGRLARGEPLRSLPSGGDEIGRLGRAMEAAATRLGKAQNLLRGVIDGTSDVVFVKDLEGRYLLMNEAGCSYLDRPLDQIIGRTDEELYEAELAASIRDADQATLRTGETSVHETVDTVRGMPRTFLTTKGPFRDGSGRVAGLFGIARDITDRREAERAISEMNEKLRQQAIIDELTGLHNRRAFMAIGEHEVRSATRTRQPLVVIFADLDRMKAINDTFGHAEGDQALRDVADILRTALRSSDVVARLGGDEFAALLPDCPTEQAAAILHRIDEAIQRHRGTRPFDLSLSLGVTTHEPGTPEAFEDLIRRADAAMYEQKASRAVR
ncbi:MAG TPA: diguanylate cyclase, partial [Actinomycetota bacterium]|nr:diguanylate cyclase [Actinomycetota bacterium]